MPLAELLALLAPPLCVACRAPLPDARRLLCASCLRELPWLGADGCRRCWLPHHGGRACPATGAEFDTAWAPLAYEGAARELVRALKFRGALPVLSLMSAQVATNLPGWARGDAAVVVAAPAVPARRRRRGFDPAAALAAGVAQRLGLPVSTCLRRTGRPVRQLGAGGSERRAAGRIGVQATRAVAAPVLLVDDVHTTGATLRACAGALRAAGAPAVHAVTYARVP